MDKAAESVCCKSFKSPVITNEGKFIIVLREGAKQNLLFRWNFPWSPDPPPPPLWKIIKFVSVIALK
jgi:hypothetical protein